MICLPLLYLLPDPLSLTEHNMLTTTQQLERICRRCANSYAGVPGWAWARPLRRGSPVGKCFACRTQLVTNPVTMSRKSQRMTTRPSCPTTPLLAGRCNSYVHVACSGPIRRLRKILLMDSAHYIIKAPPSLRRLRRKGSVRRLTQELLPPAA